MMSQQSLQTNSLTDVNSFVNEGQDNSGFHNLFNESLFIIQNIKRQILVLSTIDGREVHQHGQVQWQFFDY